MPAQGTRRREVDALVTDVHLPSAVSGVRGLGRAGVSVLALAPTRTAAGRWSRFATLRAVGPDVALDASGFVARVATLAAGYGPVVVYPGREGAVDALLDADPPLPAEAIVPYPEATAVRALRDKRTLGDLARAAGLRTPRELARGSVAELAASPPPLPCALKPAQPERALASAKIVSSRAGLESLLTTLPPDEPLVAQERLDGEVLSLALVLDREGAVVARIQSIGSRTWPREAGAVAFATSVRPDARLIERCARMLRMAGYWGFAHLQFLAGAGGPALIDFNPRFYSSLPLALACGANLPAAWHDVVIGRGRFSPSPYRLGVSYRWLEADLTAARHGERGAVLRRAPAPRSGAMWASDDPVPAVLLGKAAVGLRVRQRLRAVQKRMPARAAA